MKRKILWYTVSIIIIAISLIFVMAPVDRSSTGNLRTGYTIQISKTPKEAFAYLGKSANAAKWSTYVDHISVLSGEDGKAGCKRRCFQNQDETGIRWDETILVVDTFKTRRLSIYNAVGFPMYIDGLVTGQEYMPSGDGTSLALVLDAPENISFIDRIKFYLGSYKVKSVFKANLENIRREIEQ